MQNNVDRPWYYGSRGASVIAAASAGDRMADRPPRTEQEIIRKVLVIGIGAGNPDYVTVQAINALNEVAVFFIMDKGHEKEDLVCLRKEICARYVKDRSYRTVEKTDPPPGRSASSH
jgi:hypothetical protein